MELVFNPRNNMEKYVSQALRFIHPYLAFVTYRFHVEKAREAGKTLLPSMMITFLNEISILFF
jgi:hypothetical protein